MITDIINFDPSTITITRHTKVKHAGGFSWTTTTLAPMNARIYFYVTRNAREYTIAEGEIKQAVLGMLVDGITADIRCDHKCYDTFDLLTIGSPAELRTYRVVGVRRYDDSTVEAQTQVDCIAV